MGLYFAHQENAALRKSAALSGNEIAVGSHQKEAHGTGGGPATLPTGRNTGTLVVVVVAEALGGEGGGWACRTGGGALEGGEDDQKAGHVGGTRGKLNACMDPY